jgi:hypothetical protein
MVDALLEEISIWEKEESEKEPASTNGNHISLTTDQKLQLPVIR